MNGSAYHVEPCPQRSESPGGQHVGAGPVGVKVTHIPTGIVAICQHLRSQHYNREVCLSGIDAMLKASTASNEADRTIAAQLHGNALAVLREILAVDGGEGSSCFSATRLYDARQRGLALIAGTPQQQSVLSRQGLVARLSDSAQLSTLPKWCRDMLEEAADVLSAAPTSQSTETPQPVPLIPANRRVIEQLRDRLRDQEREGFPGGQYESIERARQVRAEIAALDAALLALSPQVER